MSPPAQAAPSLAEEIGGLSWYHTMELAPGVETPGWNDTRPIAPAVPFPDLVNRRCLDVGTYDGFWAFEMERRGAAEVVAVDVLDPRQWDWPAGSAPEVVEEIGSAKAGGRGFEIARRALGSSVERLERSVYDLDADEVGRFDVVFVGSLLVHLRDPVRALERLRAVCDGTLVVVDGIDLLLSLLLPRRPVATLDGAGRPWWWTVNQAGLARLVEAAGFDLVDGPRRLFIPGGAGKPRARLRPEMLRTRLGRYHLLVTHRGDPHAALAARPR
jgi:tRNA (mo5U34)-methyltransferase